MITIDPNSEPEDDSRDDPHVGLQSDLPAGSAPPSVNSPNPQMAANSHVTSKPTNSTQSIQKSEPSPGLDAVTAQLLQDVRLLVVRARTRAASAINQELTLLYWDIGQRSRRDVIGRDGGNLGAGGMDIENNRRQRAAYGEQIVSTLSAQLTGEFGTNGFSRRNLFRMIQFAEQFPSRDVVERLGEVLTWSHFVEILPLRNPIEREFYASMCHACRWSIRGLRKEIDGALFTRTGLSRNTEELVRQSLAALRDEDKWTPDLVLRDPYLLPFLGLADTYSEKELEDAILREIEAFLLEMGVGFTFAARQKRIVIDGEDHVIDLLLYHRKLRRLVVVELKVGPFRAAHKGQMELYLRWLDRHEREPSEEAPLGILLCTEAGAEQIELLQIGTGDIHVAEYITEQLPRPLLLMRLREAERRGRERIQNSKSGTDATTDESDDAATRDR